MDDDFQLRALARSDAASIGALAQSLPQWFNRQGLLQLQKDTAIARGWVAVAGEALVGFVLWSPLSKEVAELKWMAVAPNVQRRGVGSSLVGALRADVAGRGIRAIEVSTVAESADYPPYDGTRSFYRALGFQDLRVDPLFYGSGTDRYDRLVLRLEW